MKKYLVLLASIGLFTSCISTKSTIKNIDENAKKPPLASGMFIISEYSTLSKYGIDQDYPINIGIIHPNSEESYAKYFFNGLEGPNGEKIIFKKIDTCCPFSTKHSNMGAGMLSIYEVHIEGTAKKLNFYFNIYEKGQIACPIGFKIKKRPELRE